MKEASQATIGPECRQLFLQVLRQHSAGLQVASKRATKGQMVGPGLQGERNPAGQHAAVLLQACAMPLLVGNRGSLVGSLAPYFGSKNQP